MKEQHLVDAMQITAEISGLRKAQELVSLGVWSICRIGSTEEEHLFASVALGSNEEWIKRVAKEALLSDITKQIASRRMKLKDLGVELEDEQRQIEDKEKRAA